MKISHGPEPTAPNPVVAPAPQLLPAQLGEPRKTGVHVRDIENRGHAVNDHGAAPSGNLLLVKAMTNEPLLVLSEQRLQHEGHRALAVAAPTHYQLVPKRWLIPPCLLESTGGLT